MKLDPEANFAACDIITDYALVLRFVDQLALAANTFEASIILRNGILTRHKSLENFRSVFNRFFCFLFTPFFRIFFKNFEPFVTPVGTTERALHLFSTWGVVFEAPRKTLSVQLASAAKTTMRQIFLRFHLITTDATRLTSLHRPRWNCSPRFYILLDVFPPIWRPCEICIAS